MKQIDVRNIVSWTSGREIANQFLIFTDEGLCFQSYATIIAFKPKKGKIQLDKYSWDYSTTTGKYRNQFLGEKIKETRKKIENGTYELVDLN